MIRCLVRHGADLSRDYVGGAGMNAALRNRDEEVCDLLRELGVEYGPREMVALNRFEELRHAVEEKPSIIPERVAPFETHWRGEDPSLLGIALCYGYREMAVFLIDQGAPLDASEGEGATLLHRAARGGDPELIRLLVAGGLDVNARDDHGETPLLKNILYGSPEAIDALIELGAEVDARGISEETALHRAATHQRTEVVRELLVAGADPAIANGNGRTVLEAVREQLEWRLEERDDASSEVQWREECDKAVRNYREIEELLLEAER
jgi:Ankyrin repeats (3 copies)/Ankyrin repeat